MAGKHQQGAQALAAVEHRITHGVNQSRRGMVIRTLVALGTHPGFQRTLHTFELQRHPGGKIKIGHNWGRLRRRAWA